MRACLHYTRLDRFIAIYRPIHFYYPLSVFQCVFVVLNQINFLPESLWILINEYRYYRTLQKILCRNRDYVSITNKTDKATKFHVLNTRDRQRKWRKMATKQNIVYFSKSNEHKEYLFKSFSLRNNRLICLQCSFHLNQLQTNSSCHSQQPNRHLSIILCRIIVLCIPTHGIYKNMHYISTRKYLYHCVAALYHPSISLHLCMPFALDYTRIKLILMFY